MFYAKIDMNFRQTDKNALIIYIYMVIVVKLIFAQSNIG